MSPIASRLGQHGGVRPQASALASGQDRRHACAVPRRRQRRVWPASRTTPAPCRRSPGWPCRYFADWCSWTAGAEGCCGGWRWPTGPGESELAHDLHRRYPPDPRPPGPLAHPQDRRAQMVVEITDDLLSERGTRPLRILRQLGRKSLRPMCVPLMARRRYAGALTFVAAESGRRYGDAAIWPLAEDLAPRAAIAMENARLYATEGRRPPQGRVPGDAGPRAPQPACPDPKCGANLSCQRSICTRIAMGHGRDRPASTPDDPAGG